MARIGVGMVDLHVDVLDLELLQDDRDLLDDRVLAFLLELEFHLFHSVIVLHGLVVLHVLGVREGVDLELVVEKGNYFSRFVKLDLFEVLVEFEFIGILPDFHIQVRQIDLEYHQLPQKLLSDGIDALVAGGRGIKHTLQLYSRRLDVYFFQALHFCCRLENGKKVFIDEVVGKHKPQLLHFQYVQQQGMEVFKHPLVWGGVGNHDRRVEIHLEDGGLPKHGPDNRQVVWGAVFQLVEDQHGPDSVVLDCQVFQSDLQKLKMLLRKVVQPHCQ